MFKFFTNRQFFLLCLLLILVPHANADDQIFKTTLTLPKSAIANIVPSVEKKTEELYGKQYFPLRFFVSDVTEDVLVIEAVIADKKVIANGPDQTLPPSLSQHRGRKNVVISLIPTGIQAEFGGWAGDATPVTRLLAKAADILVTNPNAVNASNFIDIPENLVYSEGSQIDLLMEGKTQFSTYPTPKIGVVIEKTDAVNLARVMNLINTARSLGGVEIAGIEVTPESIGSKVDQSPSGAYVGKLDRPEVLLAAAKKLVQKGATAIAVTSLIKGYDEDLYLKHFAGNHPNPIGGVETIISHLLVKALGIPAAHGPLLNFKPEQLTSSVVDPRGAGEYVSECGLYCVLRGLSQSPHMEFQLRHESNLDVEDVIAIVAPAGALGSISVLEANRRGIPVIAVQANKTILDVTAAKLGLTNAIEVESYIEAAGVIDLLSHTLMKSGQNVRDFMSRAHGQNEVMERGKLVAQQARLSIESLERPLRPLSCDQIMASGSKSPTVIGMRPSVQIY